MTTIMKFPLGFILFFFFYTSVTGKSIDESFCIPVEGSELFVRVSGNESKPLIIYLHGGPGGFSTLEHELFKDTLEQDFLIAYLDQRGCGRSAEVNHTAMLNMEQYLGDLDGVIENLLGRYDKEKVNLMGISWGGTYGLLYLLQDQSKVATMVSIGGVANGPYSYRDLIRKERGLAKKIMESATDKKKILQYQHILAELERIENSDFDQFFEDMNLIKHKFPKMLDFDPYRVKAQKGPPGEEFLQDANIDMETLLSFFSRAEVVNKAFRSDPAYNNLNILDEISAIRVPVLVIQGEKDFSIGIDQAKMMHAALSKKSAGNKHLKIIENTGHSTTAESPDKTIPVIKEFLDKYNGRN